MKDSKTVDEYIICQERWRSELIELRAIMLASGMDESIKWGVPVYSINGKNIAGIAGFKLHFAIWFYQGAMLIDKSKKLINAQEGATRALRQWKFTSFDEIEPDLILDYLKEAIQNEISGNTMPKGQIKTAQLPEELKEIFSENDFIKQNFEKLSPYKQNEYIIFLQSAKRQDTKEKRLEKIITLLSEARELNDKYR
jgi:uncharacterized protein YdeI (YjbR/CyaY-like superfamily)